MKIGEFINKNFDHVYVRNLPKARKRLDSFQKTASYINLKYEIFKSINGNDYVEDNYPRSKYLTGNVLSFINVLLDAMKNNYKSIVVCDDDCIFYNYEINENLEIDFFPENWDIINFGKILHGNEEFKKIEFENIKNKPKLIEGSQCMAFNKKSYFLLLRELFFFEKTGLVGDGLYDILTQENKINGYIIKPSFCFQERDKLIQSDFNQE